MNTDVLESTNDELETLKEICQLAASRRAGSTDEEPIKAYVESSIANYGYTFTRQSFKFPSIPFLFNEPFVDSILILITLILFMDHPLIACLLPFVISILPVLMLDGSIWFPHKNTAQNLIVHPVNSRLEDARILLVAHLDSARVIPKMRNLFIVISRICEGATGSLAYVLGGLAILRLLNFSIPIGINVTIFTLIIVSTLITIIHQLWLEYFTPPAYSPGANDNASGVAAVISLLRSIYKNNPDKAPNIAILFTSSEEEGLFGARAFVKSKIKWNYKPVVINVDSIGGGNQLGLVRRYGRLFPFNTSDRINNIFKEYDKQLVDIIHLHRSGDYLPFIRNGYKTASLESVQNGGTPREYHTTEDTFDFIHSHMYMRANFLLKQVIWSVLNFGDK